MIVCNNFPILMNDRPTFQVFILNYGHISSHYKLMSCLNENYVIFVSFSQIFKSSPHFLDV